jgi:hypothetical protein
MVVRVTEKDQECTENDIAAVAKLVRHDLGKVEMRRFKADRQLQLFRNWLCS